MIRPLILAAATLLASCAPAAPPQSAAPAATETHQRRAFLAAAHPLAVEAGLDVLRRGPGDARACRAAKLGERWRRLHGP
jgi:gamma-glutamyltranspeptidase/glutathione hydrolase